MGMGKVLTNTGGGKEVSVYHIWTCDTWCSEENLEEYLSFMSDDYITVKVVGETEYYEVPRYDEAVENGLVYSDVGEEDGK